MLRFQRLRFYLWRRSIALWFSLRWLDIRLAVSLAKIEIVYRWQLAKISMGM